MDKVYYSRVQVRSAPGYADFEGTLLVLTDAVDSRGSLCVIMDYEGIHHVIPSRCVSVIKGK